MKLTEKHKLLLFRILKPFQPSDDWTKKEELELANFYLRLTRSLAHEGYDLKTDIQLAKDSIEFLKAEK